MTEDEMAKAKRYTYLKVAGGVILTVVSVPVLVVLLNVTRILERLS